MLGPRVSSHRVARLQRLLRILIPCLILFVLPLQQARPDSPVVRLRELFQLSGEGFLLTGPPRRLAGASSFVVASSSSVLGRWRAVPAGGHGGPAGSRIKQLVLGPHGGLWVVSDRGLSRLGGGEFRHFGRRSGLPSEQILTLVTTATGVAAATREGLVWSADAPPSDAEPMTLLLDGAVQSTAHVDSRLWFLRSQRGGASRLGSFGFQGDGTPEVTPTYEHADAAPDARQLLSSSGRLLFLDMAQRWRAHPLNGHGNVALPPDLSVDILSTAAPFTLTLSGVYQTIGSEDRLLNLNGVAEGPGALALGRDGSSLWLSRGNKLYLVTWRADSKMAQLAKTVSLPDSSIATAIAEDTFGRLWVGTDAGLYLRDTTHTFELEWPRSIDPQSILIPTADDKSTAAGFTADGRLWLGQDRRIFVESPAGILSYEYADAGHLIDASIGARNALILTPKLGAPLGAADDEDDEVTREPITLRPKTAPGQFRPISSATLRQIRTLTLQDVLSINDVRDYPISENQYRSARNFQNIRGKILSRNNDLSILQYGGSAEVSLVYANPEINQVSNNPVNESVTLHGHGLSGRVGAIVRDFVQKSLIAINESNIVYSTMNDSLLWMLQDSEIMNLETTNTFLVTQQGVPILRHSAGLWKHVDKAPASAVKESDGAPSKKSWRPLLSTVDEWVGARFFAAEPGKVGVQIGDAQQAINQYWTVSLNSAGNLRLDAPVRFPISAYLRDLQGNAWISTGQNLFQIASNGTKKDYLLVSDLLNAKILQIMAATDEYVFIKIQKTGESSAQLWKVFRDKKHSSKKYAPIHDFNHRSVAHKVTVQGQSILIKDGPVVSSPQAFTGPDKLLQSELTAALHGSDSLPYVLDYEHAEDEILFLEHEQGLVANVRGAIHRVPLPGWHASHDGFVRMLPRHGVLVAARWGANLTRLWLRPAPGKDFAQLADVDDELTDATEGPNGQIWLAAYGGQLFELRGGKVVSLGNVMGLSGGNQFNAPLLGSCVLRGKEERLLVLPHDHAPLLIVRPGEKGEQRHRLNLSLAPFHGCVALSDESYLLLHGASVSLLSLTRSGGVASNFAVSVPAGQRFIDIAQTLPASGHKPYVAVLSEQAIYLYEEDRGAFSIRVELPAKLAVAADRLKLVGGVDTFFLGTPGMGLWMVAKISADSEKIAALSLADLPHLVPILDEVDGLPSNVITALLPESDGRLLLFTDRGPAEALPLSDHRFEARLLSQNGIIGSRVRAAALGRLHDDSLIALGTNAGIQLIEHKPKERDIQQNGRWTLYDRDSGLLSNDVQALAWHQTGPLEGVLWAGTRDGVVLLEVSSRQGKLHIFPSETITEAQGLPVGEITAIQLSDDGEDGWILSRERPARTEGVPLSLHSMRGARWRGFSGPEEDNTATATYRLSRWSRAWGRRGGRWNSSAVVDGQELEQVVSSEPFLLANVKQVRLGPSTAGRAPQLIVQDKDGIFALHDPAMVVLPRLRLKNRFFWITAEIDAGSLDPRDDDLKPFSLVRLAIDRLDGGSSLRRSFLPPDLLENRPHRVFVELVRWDAGLAAPVRAVASASLVRLTSGQWLARLFILGGLLSAALTLSGAYLARQLLQRKRLRSKAIPYVQGEAITDPAKFFGREKLMVLLRDTIATTNYALVGEFRIGKTSIQHQLSRLLRAAHHPEYTFFPIFIDLQLLGVGRSERFFFFLAGQLLKEAQGYGMPDSIVANLEHTRLKDCVEQYNAIYFNSDIGKVLEGLAAKAAPRKPMLVFQIDEVMLMEHVHPDTRLGFRSLFVGRTEIKTVLTGPRLPKDHEIDRLSPWWNFLQEEEVGPLSPSEAHELIVSPVRGLFSYDKDAIDEIIKWAVGRPLVLQGLCAAILQYQYSRFPIRRRIRLSDVQDVVRARSQREQARKSATRFVPGPPARGVAFYGRSREVHSALAQHWTWICGQRRIGKSSLLHRIVEKAKESGRIPLFFDLAMLPSRGATGAELFRLFVYQQTQLGLLPKLLLKPDELSSADAAVQFRRVLEGLATAGQKVVLLWDEAERLIDVERQDPGFLERLRAQLYGLASCQLILAGTQLLTTLYELPGHVSPFLQSFLWLPLGGLSDEDAAALLQRRHTGGWTTPIAEGVLRELLQFCGGHPYILQQCGAFLSADSEDDGARIDDGLLRRCRDTLVADLNLRQIIQDDFAKLTPTQQILFRVLCKQEFIASVEDLTATGLHDEAIDRDLGFLSDYGYAMATPDLGYRLRCEFYRRMLPALASPSAVRAELAARIGEASDPAKALGVPTVASVRKLLSLVLPQTAGIDTFCIDHYPELHASFAGAMTYTDRVNLLLTRQEPDDIVRLLREDHPDKLLRHQHVLRFRSQS